MIDRTGSWANRLWRRVARAFNGRHRPQPLAARPGDDALREIVRAAIEPGLAERVDRLQGLLVFGIGTFMVRRRYFPSPVQIKEIAEIVAAADEEHRQAGPARVVH